MTSHNIIKVIFVGKSPVAIHDKGYMFRNGSTFDHAYGKRFKECSLSFFKPRHDYELELVGKKWQVSIADVDIIFLKGPFTK